MTVSLASRFAPRAVARVAASAALLVATSCTVPVATDLDDTEANRIVAVLTGSGIAADKAAERGETGRFRVEVPRDDGPRAASLLGDEGLPAEKKRGVLDALGGNSLVPSRAAEHERLLSGVAGDLERTLVGVDRVVTARVHLAVPRTDPLADGVPVPPSASVLLRYRGGEAPLGEADIQRLVAGAVPNLSTSRISVVRLAVPEPAPRADLVRVGPASLTREAATKVRLVIAGVALSNLALVGCLVALWMRVRKLRPLERPASSTRARDAR